MSGAAPFPDDVLVRTAARRIGWQIAAACGVAVLVVAALAFALVLHHRGGEGAPRPGGVDDDPAVRDALLIAGLVGIVIAGVVGYLAARRAVRPLGEALALQRRFVADAGHELRTPLTVLHTRAQMLARRLPVGGPDRVLAERLLDDSRQLAEVIDELLLSAQLSADPSRGEPVDLADLSREACAGMEVLAEQAGVQLESPECGTPVVVNGSRSGLRRAIVGLVDNAIGHTPAGGQVQVRVVTESRRAVLRVTDTGGGLAGVDSAQLTERFARGREDQAPGGRQRIIGAHRYGLGLALIREIAVAHGGSFDLMDRPGGTGAVATLRLPCPDEAKC